MSLTTPVVIRAAASPSATMRPRLRELVARRRQMEDERLLLDSIDRFELERREHAWNRWQSSEGGLLRR